MGCNDAQGCQALSQNSEPAVSLASATLSNLFSENAGCACKSTTPLSEVSSIFDQVAASVVKLSIRAPYARRRAHRAARPGSAQSRHSGRWLVLPLRAKCRFQSTFLPTQSAHHVYYAARAHGGPAFKSRGVVNLRYASKYFEVHPSIRRRPCSMWKAVYKSVTLASKFVVRLVLARGQENTAMPGTRSAAASPCIATGLVVRIDRIDLCNKPLDLCCNCRKRLAIRRSLIRLNLRCPKLACHSLLTRGKKHHQVPVMRVRLLPASTRHFL